MSVSPVLLEGDVDCTLGQQGKVYFLAGLPVALPDDPDELPIILTGERTCTIPRGKALFFPIVNAAFVNDPGEPPFSVDEKRELLDSVIAGARNFCGAAVTVDDNLAFTLTLVTARTQSPPFLLEFGPDDVFGNPEGHVDDEVVSDGFWVMVPPLAAGPHEVTFKGSFCLPQDEEDPSSPLDPFFSVEMTYNLTVGR